MSRRPLTLRLKADSKLLRLLRTPLVVHRDTEAAEESRWMWRKDIIAARDGDLGGPQYTLTPLGILHTLTGLTIRVKP